MGVEKDKGKTEKSMI